MMTFKVVIVSPELAAEWLKRNRKNRPINKDHVGKLVRDIKAGRWAPSPQPIVFDVDGDLIDGQHRLTAVVVAGVSIQMVIAENAPRESIRGIDMGAQRNAVGILSMLHDHSPKVRAMAISNAMITGVRRETASRYSKQEQVEFYLEHRGAVDYAIGLLPVNYRHCKRGQVGAVIARASYTVGSETLERFCAVLTTGVASDPIDATAILARDWLMTHSSAGGMASCVESYSKVARALDAYRRGEVIKKLYAATVEPFPIKADR